MMIMSSLSTCVHPVIFRCTVSEKWSTLRPTENIPGLAAEMQESISCEECFPACSDTTYHVQTSSAGLSQTPYLRSGLMWVHCDLVSKDETSPPPLLSAQNRVTDVQSQLSLFASSKSLSKFLLLNDVPSFWSAPSLIVSLITNNIQTAPSGKIYTWFIRKWQ
jgi:hypothetical protein